MKKQTFVERCLCFSLSLVLILSLSACSGANSNNTLLEIPRTELTEKQKEDIISIAYDIVPKTLFVMQNGAIDQVAFLKNSTHVAEHFRESAISSTKKCNVARYNRMDDGYVTGTVFTSTPVIMHTSFCDFYYESGTYSVTVRMILSCTLQQKEFGGAWREGTPYQETRAYDCSISWDEDECYLIQALYLV